MQVVAYERPALSKAYLNPEGGNICANAMQSGLSKDAASQIYRPDLLVSPIGLPDLCVLPELAITPQASGSLMTGALMTPGGACYT